MIVHIKTKGGSSIPLMINDNLQLQEGLKEAGITDQTKKIVEKNFESLHQHLISLTKEFHNMVNNIEADSCTVQIGFNFSQELGFFVANSTIGVDLSVSLQWNKKNEKSNF